MCLYGVCVYAMCMWCGVNVCVYAYVCMACVWYVYVCGVESVVCGIGCKCGVYLCGLNSLF